MTPARPTEKRNGYTLEGDLQPILDGKHTLPNFEPWSDEELRAKLDNLTLGVNNITRGRALLPGSTYPAWALFFLHREQFGGYNGEGYVIVYGGWTATHKGAHVGAFAICKHEKVEGPGANHSRGWHPGWCGKCGMDMSVDSGD